MIKKGAKKISSFFYHSLFDFFYLSLSFINFCKNFKRHYEREKNSLFFLSFSFLFESNILLAATLIDKLRGYFDQAHHSLIRSQLQIYWGCQSKYNLL